MTDPALDSGRIVVVSPHLDDAAFSLGSTVARATRAGARVELLTVFANDPGSPAPARKWDRRAGFATEGEASSCRRREDEKACAALGASPIWLPYADGDYLARRPSARARAEVLADVAALMEGADAVLLPGFPLTNPDHLWLTRTLLKGGLPVARIGLYVEQPYRHAARGTRPRPDRPQQLSDLLPDDLKWVGYPAERRDARTKREAIRCYSSQLDLLGFGSRRRPLRRLLSHEARQGGEAIAWLPPDTAVEARPPRGARTLRLVMTLLVRDEADLIREQIDFHLSAGVDFVVATDHDSSDGTTEILEEYERDGVLHLIRQSDPRYRQSEWVTRMARLAATDHGADWVINSDADEFWWPSGGNLKDVLEVVPERYGVVRTFVRPFLPRPGDARFLERMTVRLAPAAAINDPASSFRVNVRLLHRASPVVVVGRGNASVTGVPSAVLGGWSPVEVFHYPIRAFTQFERKFLTHFETVGGDRGDHARARRAAEAGLLRAVYDRMCIDEAMLRRGLADGSLALDTRIRDAVAPGVPSPRTFPVRAPSERTGYAVDGAVLVEGETMRLFRRVDELERRVVDAERRGRRRASRGAGASSDAVGSGADPRFL